MKTTRKMSRRSFLGRVVGGAVVGGSVLTTLNSPAEAQPWNDNDSGAGADPAGGGRRPCTDNDSGANSDPANRGRGNGRTDSDTGAGRDRAGCGRR